MGSHKNWFVKAKVNNEDVKTEQSVNTKQDYRWEEDLKDYQEH